VSRRVDTDGESALSKINGEIAGGERPVGSRVSAANHRQLRHFQRFAMTADEDHGQRTAHFE